MQPILQMAIKDIKLILRDRLGLIFIVFFPILMGLFFGLMMGGVGSGGSSGKMKIALIDQDQSVMSGKFVEALQANDNLKIDQPDLESARDSVRRGQQVGMIVIPPGFGERAGVFWGDPPEIQLGMDPSRGAESAMLEGFVMQAMGGLIGERFQNPASFRPFLQQSRQELAAASGMPAAQRFLMTGFFDSLDSMINAADALGNAGDGDNDPLQTAGAGLQFANIRSLDITRQIDPQSQAAQLQKIRSGWDISFPQAMLWGVLGCVASFAISIARERTLGTMLRLQVAPLGNRSILAGKALACFLTVLGVIAMMTVLGVMLGMKPASYPKLVAASLCVAAAFTGIMMVVSLLGAPNRASAGPAGP